MIYLDFFLLYFVIRIMWLKELLDSKFNNILIIDWKSEKTKIQILFKNNRINKIQYRRIKQFGGIYENNTLKTNIKEQQEGLQDERNKKDYTKLWNVNIVNININYKNYINKATTHNCLR